MDKDALNYAHICTGKMFTYQVCEDGSVIKTSRKRFVESKVKPYLKRGHAVVKINQKEYKVKNLVAAHFIKGYRKGDYIEVLNGNTLNCEKMGD